MPKIPTPDSLDSDVVQSIAAEIRDARQATADTEPPRSKRVQRVPENPIRQWMKENGLSDP